MERFDQLLTNQDRTQKQYLINGFRVNFIGELTSFESPYIKSSRKIWKFCFRNYLKNLTLGGLRDWDLSTLQLLLVFVLRPLAQFPKRFQIEFRLIHHLSYPKGLSVNDSGRLRFSTKNGFTLIVASWVIREGWREFKDLYWNSKPANSS